jgi:ATP-dependent Clp protease adaptor protein ClpS
MDINLFEKNITMNTNPIWREETDVALMEDQSNQHVLILFNDDYNTFDHVIQSLIEICNHTTEQAEQCAWLVHFKGKCEVKTGSLKVLEKYCSMLLNRGLSAKVK